MNPCENEFMKTMLIVAKGARTGMSPYISQHCDASSNKFLGIWPDIRFKRFSKNVVLKTCSVRKVLVPGFEPGSKE